MKGLFTKHYLPVTIAATLLASCSHEVIRTASLPPDTSTKDSIPIHGIPYFLPRALVPIKIQLSQSGSGPSSPNGDARNADNSPASHGGNSTGNQNTAGNTPQTKSEDGTAQKLWQAELTVSPAILAPDPTKAFTLEYNESAWSDDKFQLRVDASGLMQSTDMTSTDKSAEVVLQGFEIAKSIAETILAPGSGGFGAFGGGDEFLTVTPDNTAQNGITKIKDCGRLAFSHQYLMDPSPSSGKLSDQSISANINADQDIQVTITSSPLATVMGQKSAFHDAAAGAPSTCPIGEFGSNCPNANGTGVFFRQSQPYLVDIQLEADDISGLYDVRDSIATTENDPASKVQRALSKRARRILQDQDDGRYLLIDTCPISAARQQILISAPNDSPIFAEDVRSASLVASHHNLIVQNGMLIGEDIDKPSQVLAGVTLPATIVKEILSIPKDLLTLRIQQLGQENQLTEAQVKALEDAIALIQQQQALAAAKKAATAAP